jgi:hypothetical protein
MGARLSLTTVLSHFPELESELGLLGFRYNASLTDGEMEILWTRTRRVSETISSRVFLSATRSPREDAKE